MSFFPGTDPVPGDAFACDAIEHLIIPRSSDIGGFSVRRALPSVRRRLVGPFIFFDRMGPAILKADEAMDVRPHPHIGLSTVTYLFDGEIKHRDSLGTELVIAPGDINLMTAGRGIVHSERTPENLRGHPLSMSGLQTWLALPDGKEEIDAAFEHVAKDDLPLIEDGGVSARIIMGSLWYMVDKKERLEYIDCGDLLMTADDDPADYVNFRENVVVVFKPHAFLHVKVNLDSFGMVTSEMRVPQRTGQGADPTMADLLCNLHAIGRKTSGGGHVYMVTADNICVELVPASGARDIIGLRLVV